MVNIYQDIYICICMCVSVKLVILPGLMYSIKPWSAGKDFYGRAFSESWSIWAKFENGPMFRKQGTWLQLLTKFKLHQTMPFRTIATKSTNNNIDKVESSISKYNEAYCQLDKLDFTTAAKILFTGPPKEKKFG